MQKMTEWQLWLGGGENNTRDGTFSRCATPNTILATTLTQVVDALVEKQLLIARAIANYSAFHITARYDSVGG